MRVFGEGRAWLQPPPTDFLSKEQAAVVDGMVQPPTGRRRQKLRQLGLDRRLRSMVEWRPCVGEPTQLHDPLGLGGEVRDGKGRCAPHHGQDRRMQPHAHHQPAGSVQDRQLSRSQVVLDEVDWIALQDRRQLAGQGAVILDLRRAKHVRDNENLAHLRSLKHAAGEGRELGKKPLIRRCWPVGMPPDDQDKRIGSGLGQLGQDAVDARARVGSEGEGNIRTDTDLPQDQHRRRRT